MVGPHVHNVALHPAGVEARQGVLDGLGRRPVTAPRVGHENHHLCGGQGASRALRGGEEWGLGGAGGVYPLTPKQVGKQAAVPALPRPFF